MIKYLGSKRRVIPVVEAAILGLPGVNTALDLFSGTSRVGQALKRGGLTVHSNDHNRYAHAIARCYIEADADTWRQPVTEWVERLSTASPIDGWFTQTFCRDARYFKPENGAQIEGVRQAIVEAELPDVLTDILLVSLMEAADRVDSTTGVQMAYLKQWAARAHKPLQLRVPELLAGQGTASCSDAEVAASSWSGDVAYLDPPYNQHSYRGNYHVWETLVRGDAPEVYGVARKRVDCKTEKSDFNSKRRIHEAMQAVCERVDARFVVVSFSDEGFLNREELEEMLAPHGHVEVVSVDHPRYVGAQIGVYNPDGKKVGRATHLRNTEFVFIAGDQQAVKAAAERARSAAEQLQG